MWGAFAEETAMKGFDLISSKWIPVIPVSGMPLHVGLAEAIVGAHQFAELRDPSPLVTAALHRLLLAILHRAFDGPRDLSAWAVLWEAGASTPPALTHT